MEYAIIRNFRWVIRPMIISQSHIRRVSYMVNIKTKTKTLKIVDNFFSPLWNFQIKRFYLSFRWCCGTDWSDWVNNICDLFHHFGASYWSKCLGLLLFVVPVQWTTTSMLALYWKIQEKSSKTEKEKKFRERVDLSPSERSNAYLIFVIFFTQAKFLENKIFTKKRVNYDKLHSKLPILRVNYENYTVNCQFFWSILTFSGAHCVLQGWLPSPRLSSLEGLSFHCRHQRDPAQIFLGKNSLFDCVNF